MNEFRVGVVGLGIGDKHFTGYGNLKDQGVVIAALCDNVPAKLDEYIGYAKERYGQTPVGYEDYNKMFSGANLDAVSICVPNFLHKPVALAAFNAGCNVILEKPMANTLADAKEIHAAWKKAGTVGVAALNNNYTPGWKLVNSLIEAGEIGNISRIRGWWVRREGVPFDGFWFTNKELSGGGPGIDLMPHVLGCAMGWLKWPAVSHVWAQTSSDLAGNTTRGPYGGGKFNPNGISNVEKAITARVGAENGVIIDLDAAWGSHIDVERMGFEVIGSRGTFKMERVWPINDGDDTKAIDTWEGYTSRPAGEGEWITANVVFNPDKHPRWSDPWMGRLFTQPELLKCVREGKTPHTSLDNLLQIQQIIDAAYRSASQNQPATVAS